MSDNYDQERLWATRLKHATDEIKNQTDLFVRETAALQTMMNSSAARLMSTPRGTPQWDRARQEVSSAVSTQLTSWATVAHNTGDAILLVWPQMAEGLAGTVARVREKPQDRQIAGVLVRTAIETERTYTEAGNSAEKLGAALQVLAGRFPELRSEIDAACAAVSKFRSALVQSKHVGDQARAIERDLGLEP